MYDDTHIIQEETTSKRRSNNKSLSTQKKLSNLRKDIRFQKSKTRGKTLNNQYNVAFPK